MSNTQDPVMDEPTSEKVCSKSEDSKVPESPKALAFTIDFNEGKNVDTQRFKHLVEKYHSKHKRGKSLSKLEQTQQTSDKKPPLSGNLPRKSSFHSEGYFSSDEKPERFKASGARSSVLNSVILKGDLTLPLRQISTDRMTQSFPNRNFDLPSINSPEIELKDVSSPELDLISPMSAQKVNSSPESDTKTSEISIDENHIEICDNEFKSATDFNFDGECASDAGTYTIDADNYTEEQKIRMSIDKDFNIEKISSEKKSAEYVQSLQKVLKATQNSEKPTEIVKSEVHNLKIASEVSKKCKILYPSAKPWGLSESDQISADRGFFTSISTSGVLSKHPERRAHNRRSSLVQSEILVEAYTGSSHSGTTEATQVVHATYTLPKSNQNALKKSQMPIADLESETRENSAPKFTNLPPQIGGISGKNTPTKIPSPKSRKTFESQNLDLSDSSNETESYLKQSERIISTLQARLSLDSDRESDYEKKYTLNNNTKSLLKSKTVHVRHNSLDDRNIKLPNKLEHFHNKNFNIDQTLKSCNQYQAANHQIQNSPNNSPIRRSSSFSVKNQFESHPKCVNSKENNLNRNCSNNSIQRSASTANIRPNCEQYRRSSISSEQKSERSYHLDTESSSEDDYGKVVHQNKKDLTNTRYNRAFSLRRARLDMEPSAPLPKCPNTPEMKRKFLPDRGTSTDRKAPTRSDIQSRYMNIGKPKPPQSKQHEPVAVPSKVIQRPTSAKPPVFSRTDSGRFSTRTTKSANSAVKGSRKEVNDKKQGSSSTGGGSGSGRSNSSLSSREVDFQNWKRRKSYDPMKAAAEGKRKAALINAKKQSMTQSYTEHSGSPNTGNCNSHGYYEDDSSPSHSSSVHRSQSFHGTAALGQLMASSDDDQLTLSGDEDFSPPVSPCGRPRPQHNSWITDLKR